jgi:hypothetical protein
VKIQEAQKETSSLHALLWTQGNARLLSCGDRDSSQPAACGYSARRDDGEERAIGLASARYGLIGKCNADALDSQAERQIKRRIADPLKLVSTPYSQDGSMSTSRKAPVNAEPTISGRSCRVLWCRCVSQESTQHKRTKWMTAQPNILMSVT